MAREKKGRAAFRGGVEEMLERFGVGGGICIIDGDRGVGRQVRQVAQAWAGQKDGVVAGGEDVQQVGFAAAGRAVQGEALAGPGGGGGEPGARIFIGGGGQEAVGAEVAGLRERKGELAGHRGSMGRLGVGRYAGVGAGERRLIGWVGRTGCFFLGRKKQRPFTYCGGSKYSGLVR